MGRGATTLALPSRAAADRSAPDGDVANKRALSIAQLIENDVCVGNVPFGTIYGSQDDLRRRYGAGGGSLDEALRILEFNGVGHMRRGPGGGLLIDQPPLSLVMASIFGYLRVVCAASGPGVTMEDVALARAALSDIAVRLAVKRSVENTSAGNTGEALANRLRSQLLDATCVDPVIALAQALDDPCLHMAASCLHGLGRELAGNGSSPPRTPASLDTPERLLRAIRSGDPAEAGRCASDLVLERPANWFAEPSPVPNAFLSDDSPMNRSRVGRLVRTMAADIGRNALWEQGYFGSEAALTERYAVARATLRQALRVLEDARIVAARRGRKHGWFACAPTVELPVRQMRKYLASRQVAPDHARDLADGWRRAAGGDAANPILDLLLLGLQAFAESRPMVAPPPVPSRPRPVR